MDVTVGCIEGLLSAREGRTTKCPPPCIFLDHSERGSQSEASLCADYVQARHQSRHGGNAGWQQSSPSRFR